ncbi:ChaN family lipoprotein [Motiliproteus sediminis]|uniref:ChaN family lipoprotein n=1 Tax=Motiliproteus sediminis TaxID=1468178 RepID=UPI001AEFB677|nr:ChaN family lipoprotein [Motiliproteus sediminis]
MLLSLGCKPRSLLLASILLGLGGCALAPGDTQRDDPLIGQIIDTRSGEAITEAALLERMASADVVYLGESHDNADHHAKQKQLLEALVAKGFKPALGFEFFDVGQTGYLQQYVSGQASMMQLHVGGKAKQTPEQRLRRQLGWEQRSDRDWGFYFSLIEVAKQHQLPIFGADLPAGIKLRLSRVGSDGLNPVESHQLVRLQNDHADYRQLMYQRFRDGHCGWGEEPLLTRLYQTWNARNNRMAQSIVQMAAASEGGPVVMILGNGHTEYNRAVYGQVEYLNPGLQQLNLALQPITIEPAPLADYLEPARVGDTDFGARHELLWFTPRHSYIDPCASLNKPGG